MNVIIIHLFPLKNRFFHVSKNACIMQRAKDTLGFLFSGPADMGSAQGEIGSLVLVREMGGDGVETDDLWSDTELSDFPSLEGRLPPPQFGCSAEGLSWNA